jgi:hypothetical protein
MWTDIRRNRVYERRFLFSTVRLCDDGMALWVFFCDLT